ncbi:HalOD1 output domain-containing protein [Halorussus salinus]|uniref:HalOD1 output domain-containing protein n=1 Tax=Halorussus salinus TaxID=1364935 RepID=UPI00138F6595|nr:HalOD1 output domain-containing protein [Halorussus salinus]
MPRGNEEVGNEDEGDCESETTDSDAESDEIRRIRHRKVTPDAEEANESLLRLIANLENCEVTDLPPLYEQVDHMVEHLFSTPPPPEAQAEIEFSYHGYRIELDQDGNVSFMKLADRSDLGE